MVGRQDERHIVGVTAGKGARERRRDAGVARQRLAEDVVGRQLRQLLTRGAHVRLRGDDEDVRGREERRQPRHGLLEEARVTGQREELLRGAAPRERPEAGAGSARHDDRVHRRRAYRMATPAGGSVSDSRRAPSSWVRRYAAHTASERTVRRRPFSSS